MFLECDRRGAPSRPARAMTGGGGGPRLRALDRAAHSGPPAGRVSRSGALVRDPNPIWFKRSRPGFCRPPPPTPHPLPAEPPWLRLGRSQLQLDESMERRSHSPARAGRPGRPFPLRRRSTGPRRRRALVARRQRPGGQSAAVSGGRRPAGRSAGGGGRRRRSRRRRRSLRARISAAAARGIDRGPCRAVARRLIRAGLTCRTDPCRIGPFDLPFDQRLAV
jgi:hypothetical protein